MLACVVAVFCICHIPRCKPSLSSSLSFSRFRPQYSHLHIIIHIIIVVVLKTITTKLHSRDYCQGVNHKIYYLCNWGCLTLRQGHIYSCWTTFENDPFTTIYRPILCLRAKLKPLLQTFLLWRKCNHDDP